MAVQNIPKLTEQQKQLLLSKSAFSLPDNPSDKHFSSAQIKRKMYEGLLVLFDYINAFIDSVNSNVTLSNQDVQTMQSDIATLKSYFDNNIAKRATADANGNDIASTYETKDHVIEKIGNALNEAKSYADGLVQRSALVTTLGEASISLNGLMSADDKAHLDTLFALLGDTTDADTVVNTINEVLSIFNQYPEGVTIANALANKINISDIIDTLSSNDPTKPLSAKQGKELKNAIDALIAEVPKTYFVSDIYNAEAIESMLSTDASVLRFQNGSWVKFESVAEFQEWASGKTINNGWISSNEEEISLDTELEANDYCVLDYNGHHLYLIEQNTFDLILKSGDTVKTIACSEKPVDRKYYAGMLFAYDAREGKHLYLHSYEAGNALTIDPETELPLNWKHIIFRGFYINSSPEPIRDWSFFADLLTQGKTICNFRFRPSGDNSSMQPHRWSPFRDSNNNLYVYQFGTSEQNGQSNQRVGIVSWDRTTVDNVIGFAMGTDSNGYRYGLKKYKSYGSSTYNYPITDFVQQLI